MQGTPISLNEEQLREFAGRGYLLIPQAVPHELIARASTRIDAIVAADPPGADVRGNHFYFPPAVDEPDLDATLHASPAFDLARQLVGVSAMLDVPWQIQIALNIPNFLHKPGRPHIDSDRTEPTGEPVDRTFTLLAGVMMSDQVAENSGNLWVWPGTHLTHARYFRENGAEAFCAYPDIHLPEPVQVTGRAGDLLLAHYLLGHNIGGNFASEIVRRMLYFRIMRAGHEDHEEAFLQDAWLEFDPIRTFAGNRKRQ